MFEQEHYETRLGRGRCTGGQVSALREIGSHGWDRSAMALQCQLELSFHKVELKMQREAPGLALARGLALWAAQEIKEGTWVLWGFPNGSAVKKPPARQEMEETWVQSLDQEDPLEKEMATHSSILA